MARDSGGTHADRAGWRSWSGLARADPREVRSPTCTEEVAAVVRRVAARGGRVKMTGSGHSFTAIAVADDVMLRPERLTGVVRVHPDRVEVRAGTTLRELNRTLWRLGLGLHNMGDIDAQTVAGAISTGTHGSGGRTASLAAQVVGLELVTGTGEVLRCSATEHPEVLDLARVGLGALGVLTTVTLAVEPAFWLRAVEQPMSWAELVGRFDELEAGCDHLDAYWFPHTDRALVKRNTRVHDPAEADPLPRLRAWFDDDLLANTAYGALCAGADRVPSLIGPLNRVTSRLLGSRSYTDVAPRVFTSERRVVFKESEHAVPRADGIAVLRELRRRLDASDVRTSFPVELRTAPADDVPLSTAHGRDSTYLALHTHVGSPHEELLALAEPVLLDAGSRPHWGKLHLRDAEQLAAAHPRMGDFLALRERLDPLRVLTNAHLDRVLGP